MHYIKGLVPQSIKNIYHLFQAIWANFLYGFPSRKIKVIGVTGTNGKTTTVQMIAKIIEEAGKKVALASTINFKIGNEEWTNETKYTTLSPFAVQKFIKKSVKAGCEYLVLETSSHSLDQYRVWGVKYQTAVITNITREHLDYHKTIDAYRKAKRKLFEIVSRVEGNLVVNLDMERPEEFLDFEKVVKLGYSMGEHDVTGKFGKFKKAVSENIRVEKSESRFEVDGVDFLLHIPGKYNIENALAAICVGVSEGIDLAICSKALERIKAIPGRMERVQNENGLEIIVDYAVTPDSLEKLYELIIKTKKETSKIISVFGSCGERDRGKRPIMGKIVSSAADFVIVTNEDPYFEDPWQIINEVAEGVPICHSEPCLPAGRLDSESKQIPYQVRDDTFCFTENVNFFKIMDRREAIAKALSLAKTGDIVVVTGKGAEETMAIGKERKSWNDKQVILEEIQKL